MKINFSTRLLSCLLCLLMLVGSMQFTVLADDKGDALTDSTESYAATFSMPFYDVGFNRWSNPYITLLYSYGVVNGTSANLFTPAGNVTRAQFVKMLHGLTETALEDGTTSFTDVSKTAWYAPYVQWAVKYGVAGGVSATKFNPDGNITRQDMAVMMHRFINSLNNFELELVNQPIFFSDNAQIASYATEAVSVMQRGGIIGGIGNGNGTFRFEPRGNATREQAAKMIAVLLCQANDMSLPAAVPPPSFTITYAGVDGAEMSYKRESYDCEDSFTLPTPTMPGYEFLGWTGTGISGSPVKSVSVPAGSYGDRQYTANWKKYPDQRYVYELTAYNLSIDNDGILDGNRRYKDYFNGDNDFVRIIDDTATGTITVGRYSINGDRIKGLLLYLTATGTEFEYVYADYISTSTGGVGTVYMEAEGKVYGGSYEFEPYSGSDYGTGSLEDEHEEYVNNYLVDVYDVFDLYCSETIGSGYGIFAFGLYHV